MSSWKTRIYDSNFADKEVKDLVSAAQDARVRAYSPYSKFRVGAALLTEDGSIIPG